jgi:O-antigen/teichoic acid export membrane protein
VNSIFRIPPEFVGTARLLLLMVGGSVSLGFPLGVFSGILEGLQRFYVLNSVNIVSTIVRTVLIIIALQHGRGLLMVALITVSLPLLNGIVNAVAAFPLLQLRISRQYVKRSTLRMIAGYGSATLLITIASRLRFKTDAMVIGTFVSATAVTYFTIGSRLMDYSVDLVSGLAQLFIPMSSQSQAKGDLEGLQKILLLGNRACSFIIFPIAAGFTILGKSVIEAWVGAKYVPHSFPVLMILLFPTTLLCAQSSSGRTLWGIAKHHGWAWIVFAEGVCNLILSIILVRPYGIIGDAIGTAVTLSFTMIFLLPRYVCRLLGISLRTYVYRSFALPLVLCIPLVIVLLMMQRWFIPHHIGGLLIQVSIGALVYGLALAWAFSSGKALYVGKLGTGTADVPAMALEER